MTPQYRTAAETAARVHALEAQIDTTLALAGELIASLPHARSELGLAATMGQPVFVNAGLIISHLTAARGSAVDAHNGLEAVRRKLGLDPSLSGQQRKDDDAAVVPLRAA